MKHQVERAEPDGSVTFFENLILFVLLIFMLAAFTPGCAGLNPAVTTGGGNATVVSSEGAGLTVPDLIQYVNLAEQEALAAWQLYESTKDATTLQKVTWWLQYASGVTQKIEAVSATGS